MTSPGRGDRRGEVDQVDEVEKRRPVLLRGAPVPAIHATQVLFDDVVREFQLIGFGGDQGLDVPTRLRELADDITAIPHIRHLFLAEASAATDRGDHRADVVLELTDRAPALGAHLRWLLVEVDALARSGHLLLEPIDPQAVAFVDWVVDQIEGQLESDTEPAPYPE